jgi:hypothetical protein
MQHNVVLLFCLSACGIPGEIKLQAPSATSPAAGAAASAPATSAAPVAHTSPTASAPSAARGFWAYSAASWIADTDQVSALLSLLHDNAMTELYLSTPPTLLADANLASFIALMSDNGIAVEALIGEAAWGTDTGRADMLAQIAGIVVFNAAYAPAQRFTSIHLDVEPWIGTGDDSSWVAPLIESYQQARAGLAHTSLLLSVDFAGSKAANLSDVDRQAVVEAVDKTVLMQYEAALPDVLSRTQRFMTGVSFDGHSAMVAIRTADFSSDPDQTLTAIDQSNLGPSYAGAALFQSSF